MVEKNFGIKVDICDNGCKGMWFDLGELKMLDEDDEGLGKALEEALRSPRINDDSRGQVLCPICSIRMQPHKYKNSKEVNVDECYKCGGFFLDSGELKEIRDTYMSDAEVEVYVQQIVDSVSEHQKALKDSEQMKERNEAINHLTRFLRVSYWGRKFTQ
jgi:Zn-finger nucleic acid-binding protein|tara:strand:- start:1807 stop:2283 length:477 start_codon:yes stop_codon:yes gene_type:complete